MVKSRKARSFTYRLPSLNTPGEYLGLICFMIGVASWLLTITVLLPGYREYGINHHPATAHGTVTDRITTSGRGAEDKVIYNFTDAAGKSITNGIDLYRASDGAQRRYAALARGSSVGIEYDSTDAHHNFISGTRPSITDRVAGSLFASLCFSIAIALVVFAHVHGGFIKLILKPILRSLSDPW